MKKNILAAAIGSLLVSSIAFANGKGHSHDHDHDHDHGHSESNKMTLSSLVYQGLDLNGRACELYVSGYESHGELRVLTKVNYAIHGVTPMDMRAHFYRYDDKTNSYFEPSVDFGTPALAAIQLNDENLEADLNLVEEYEDSKQLEQFMRLDFAEMDIQGFELGLQSVLADNKDLASSMSLLDQLNQAVLVIFHHDHYHTGFCTQFQLKDHMHTAEFDLDGASDEHDDHEEDDDHGHDHDHDHGHSHN